MSERSNQLQLIYPAKRWRAHEICHSPISSGNIHSTQFRVENSIYTSFKFESSYFLSEMHPENLESANAKNISIISLEISKEGRVFLLIQNEQKALHHEPSVTRVIFQKKKQKYTQMYMFELRYIFIIARITGRRK